MAGAPGPAVLAAHQLLSADGLGGGSEGGGFTHAVAQRGGPRFHVLVLRDSRDVLLVRFAGSPEAYLTGPQLRPSLYSGLPPPSNPMPRMARAAVLTTVLPAVPAMAAMALDDTARLLLCLTDSGALHILPVHHFLFPQLPTDPPPPSSPPCLLRAIVCGCRPCDGSVGFHMKQAVTVEVLSHGWRAGWGLPACCGWFRAAEGSLFALVGTSAGLCLVVNVTTSPPAIVWAIPANSPAAAVVSVEVVWDAVEERQWLWLSLADGVRRVVLLEQKECQRWAYQLFGHPLLHDEQVADGLWDIRTVLPTHATSGPGPVTVRRGLHGEAAEVVAGHGTTLRAYDCGGRCVTQYRLPASPAQCHATPHLLLLGDGETDAVAVVARALSGAAGRGAGGTAGEVGAAVLQRLPLGAAGVPRGFLPAPIERGVAEAGASAAEVEEGGVGLVWTSAAVFELRLRDSARRLALDELEAHGTGRLALTFGLDAAALREVAADACFQRGELGQAFALYRQSAADCCKVAARHLEVGQAGVAIEYLTGMLQQADRSWPRRQAAAEQLLEAHLLQCCVFGSPGSTSATVGDPTEVRSEPGASGRSSPLDWTPSSPSVSLRRLSSVASASTPRRFRSDLSEALSPGSELATAPEAPWPALAWFLAANADYAPAHALPRLLRYGLVLLALQTAHAHRCVPLLLRALQDFPDLTLTPPGVDFLLESGHAALLLSPEADRLLVDLSPEERLRAWLAGCWECLRAGPASDVAQRLSFEASDTPDAPLPERPGLPPQEWPSVVRRLSAALLACSTPPLLLRAVECFDPAAPGLPPPPAPLQTAAVELYLIALLRCQHVVLTLREAELTDGLPEAAAIQRQLRAALWRYHGRYRPAAILPLCAEYRQPLAAAVVLERQGQLAEAFECRLRHHEATQTAAGDLTAAVLSDVAAVLRAHQSVYSEPQPETGGRPASPPVWAARRCNVGVTWRPDAPGAAQLTALHALLAALLRFWSSHNLPPPPLAALLADRLSACPDLGVALGCLWLPPPPPPTTVSSSDLLGVSFGEGLFRPLAGFVCGRPALFDVVAAAPATPGSPHVLADCCSPQPKEGEEMGVVDAVALLRAHCVQVLLAGRPDAA